MVQMKKRTKSATNNRRSHHALKAKTLLVCAKCKQPALPHRACPHCGSYRAVERVTIKQPKAKK